MINIGKQYLTPATSKVQFDCSPELQAIYGTFDQYIFNLYGYVKDSWALSAVQGAASSSNQAGHTKGTPDQKQANLEPSSRVKMGFRGLTPDLFTESTTFTPYKSTNNSFKYTKLKPHKAKKKGKSYRLTTMTCPSCLSTLKLNSSGVWTCTGDRLETWAKDFLTYNQLNDKDRTAFLLTFEDPAIFLNLLDKFNFIDKDGKRSNFQCDFTNKLGSIVHSYSISIPDPILTRRIERTLGRKLTELELNGQSDVFLRQGIYTDTYSKGAKKVKITRIRFPQDVL
jgi:hypothetical protein